MSGSDQAIQDLSGPLRWIASRSLSSGAHSRDPLAHNDGVGGLWFVPLGRVISMHPHGS